MKKQETEHTEFEFEIRMKGRKSQTVQDADLSQSCWDYIYELEHLNPQTLEEFGECNLLDDLMQNYFTWKLIYNENGLDITDKMADVEEFITKYLKKFFTAMQMDELNKLPPAFHFEDFPAEE